MPDAAVLTPKQPQSDLLVSLNDEKIDVQGPARIAWKRFRRHRPGMIGLVILIALYLMALFAGFIAPYSYLDEERDLLWAPPTKVHFADANGFSMRPFIHPFRINIDENFNTVLEPDRSQRCYVRFFAKGDSYRILGVIPTRIRLFGVDPVPTASTGDRYYARLYLMGADANGRDIFSRICYGARVSMTIGLLGALLVLVIGLAVGGASGFFGGWVDDVLQRLCEMVMLLPGFYLLLLLRFMFPASMDSVQVYFAVILILSLVGWAGFARVIRGMVLSIRREDYVQAARAMGLGNGRIISRHIIPNTMGYVVVATTLRIPGYILGESALSLLGLGIMEPTPSWGNMLNRAMDILELNQHPWVLWPGVFIFAAIMAFNLVGDGLRDAVDPRGLTK
ncbi:MAG TPA: ABC transporter permease [Tepidisphaeraceae bacterium]|jgi:peptide/nickel transport system permease protein